MTVALNGVDTLMLLPTVLRKSCIYQVFFLFSVGTLHQSRIKFLIRNFTRMLIMNFIMDWEFETVYQLGLQTNLLDN